MDDLFYYIAVVGNVFDLLVVLNGHWFGIDIAVDELDIFRTLYFYTALVTNDGYTVKKDIVYGFTLEALYIHSLLGADTGYVAERDI
jgi:hypothetical protein